ncbi:MAG: ATP synthase F0 subunit C [bacterium]
MNLPILHTVLAATQEAQTVAAAVGGGAWLDKGLLAVAAAGCIGLGAFGASRAMGKIAKAALDGTARQPEVGNKLFTTMLISMALVEALAIYCLLIAFMIIAKM